MVVVVVVVADVDRRAPALEQDQLVATHDVEQARRFERVLCLHRRQVAFGAPADVLTAPVLQETYGDELVVLEGGRAAVNVGHHHH